LREGVDSTTTGPGVAALFRSGRAWLAASMSRAMGAEGMWARADVRARWRSWLVLGVLAGFTFGLAAAGVAGARRTEDAVPRAIEASPRLDAAVLPNDPAFDVEQRNAVAALPEVEGAYPFVVPFFLDFAQPKGVEGQLVPTTPLSARAMSSVLLDGRLTNPKRADEIVIDENIRNRYGVDIGSRMVMAQHVPSEGLDALPVGPIPEGVELNFRAPLRVVGVAKSFGSTEESAAVSAGFYRMYGDRILGPINMFVTLRGGEGRFLEFQEHVQEIVGHPVNVERGSDLLGIRQAENISDVERNGLLLFALAALIGGGVLVGQALVRAVTAGAADAPAWRAMGASRAMLVRGMVLPTTIVAVAGAVTSVIVAIALSSRFPLGTTRGYDLDLGIHADWLVLLVFALGLVLAVLVTAAVTAWWRTGRARADVSRPSTVGDWAACVGLSPALVVGARLAVEPGRGRRAVPVRSALVGAIAGVLGVVACFTFRAGIDDALAQPERSGIVWDSYMASLGGPFEPQVVDDVAAVQGASAAMEALWVRALDVNDVPTPTFGIQPISGGMHPVVLAGRAPLGRDEIAFAPTTMKALGVSIGDRVSVGAEPDRRATVVGKALLPETSHTAYDQSAWMTREAVDEILDAEPVSGPEDLWDYALVRWKPGRQAAGESQLRKLAGDAFFVQSATLPGAVSELHSLRVLPLVLALFFGLLAIATVAHALVTTVRRRRHDLAIMRSFGFTARQSRIAIAWQATLLAIAGVVVGVPLGLVAGRMIWRWLANDYPVVYVPPIELVAVLLVIPAALLVVNAIAVAPGRAAARIRPAEALRVE
jgi:hypothetical protein